MKPFLWLDRTVAPLAPYVTLVRTERDYLKAMKTCGIVNPDKWVSDENGGATVHYLADLKGKKCCIVAISVSKDGTPIEIAALLVHEAVHVVQNYFEDISERNPAKEQMAYAVQYMSQTLMTEYERQITKEKS
jgi:hypothetical protein